MSISSDVLHSGKIYDHNFRSHQKSEKSLWQESNTLSVIFEVVFTIIHMNCQAFSGCIH